MDYQPPNMYQRPELHGKTGRALVVCGLWMRLGFVGATAVAVGVIQLFGSEASPLSAFALAAGGAALAALSWRRAHAALGEADEPAASIASVPESRIIRTAASA